MKHLDHPYPHFNDAKMARFCSFSRPHHCFGWLFHFMHLSMVCPRMGGSGNPGELDFGRRTWVGILASQRSPGWEIWLDRHLEKSRRSGKEWRVGAPPWKIPRIRPSQFPSSKDVWTKGSKEYCVALFLRKNVFFFMLISALSFKEDMCFFVSRSGWVWRKPKSCLSKRGKLYG